MESSNSELTLNSSSLALSNFERRLGICNSALQLSSKQALDFLDQNPKFARELIAQFYPLDNDFIKRNWGPLLNRGLLVRNENIKWNIDLIENTNKEEFCWRIFGQSLSDYGAPSAEWNFSFLQHFSEYLNWEQMSNNPYIHWDDAMLEYFKEVIDWSRLSRNVNLPISSNFIKKYFDKINWSNLSHEARLNESIVNQFQDYIDWDTFSWNEKFPWTLDFIHRNEDRLNWDNLSLNQSLPWSFKFFCDYIERFNFKHLSGIKNLPWSLNFIETYFEEWNWDDEYCLTTNPGLPWNEQFVLKFWDRWDLPNLCSGHNGMTSWNVSLIDRVLSESTDLWSFLAWNDHLPWSIDLLENYREYWNEPPINRGLYEKVFASHITQDFIDHIFTNTKC